MKLLFLLVLVAIIGYIVYVVASKMMKKPKKQKKFPMTPIMLSICIVCILLGIIGVGMYKSATQPDIQCTTSHSTTSHPPKTLGSAVDYFQKGNYDYDIGNCQQARADYTKAIDLNPSYPEAYNNRAYTNMRMGDYAAALPDLDKAITLNPRYIQALMNRGDIYNYYYAIDRQKAISDYRKVISLGGGRETSVCGHLFLARHNGWNLGTVLDLLLGNQYSCQLQ